MGSSVSSVDEWKCRVPKTVTKIVSYMYLVANNSFLGFVIWMMGRNASICESFQHKKSSVYSWEQNKNTNVGENVLLRFVWDKVDTFQNTLVCTVNWDSHSRERYCIRDTVVMDMYRK